MKLEESWISEYPKYTFNSYSRYLKLLYGQSVYRVSVDAGFSCPHRRTSKTGSGCTFCDPSGSRAPYLGNAENIQAQIENSIGFITKRYNVGAYILYFQAFSNTFAVCEKLKRIYDTGLRVAPFKELVISTRPDCIDEEKADLIASYANKGLKVWVELGLQSASDVTLQRINRAHSVETFQSAYSLLKRKNIFVAVHVIFGLPGEREQEIENTILYVANLSPDGIKIHNLNISRDSHLEKEFLEGELIAPGAERHLNYIIHALEMLPPKTLIMRLVCDTPVSRRLAPRKFIEKAIFYDRIKNEMIKRNTRQGKYYKQYS